MSERHYISLERLQSLYPHNRIICVEASYYLYPDGPIQGRETLVIPHNLPIHPDGTPYDITTPYHSKTATVILKAFGIDSKAIDSSFSQNVYSMTVRFGDYFKSVNGDQHEHFFWLSNPVKARGIQLLIEHDNSEELGWMQTVSPFGERLKQEAQSSYTLAIPSSHLCVTGYILLCDYRTEEIQHSCAAKRPLF